MKRKNNIEHIDSKLLPKIAEIRILLEKQYPDCFFPAKIEPKPLKIGISKEIFPIIKKLYPDIVSRKNLNGFMVVYTSSIEYNKCLQKDKAVRISLQGDEIEAVSTEHKQMAKDNPRGIKIFTKKITETILTTHLKPLQEQLQKINTVK